MSMREELKEILDDLREERDELRVRLHLLKAEARDEWRELETKFEHFKARSHQVKDEAGDAGEDISAAVRLLGQEIRNGYIKIRNTLK